MTSETKKFLELSDIVGLRLKCKSCGCSLLLETEREDGTINDLLAAHNRVLSKCPTCDQGWTHTDMGTGAARFDSEIKDLFRKIQDVKKLEARFGCALSLEIRDEKKP